MSRNIKEIGKELMGKSLNSFHRKTGLTQLEKNNEMQDGILDGILSQVDDAYIEKTEQSNVIHLDGSGDGVVVVDSIEGNTMVNFIKKDNSSWGGNVNDSQIRWSVFRRCTLNQPLKSNTTYTLLVTEKPSNGTHLYINYHVDGTFIFSAGYKKCDRLVFTTPTIPNGTVHSCIPHIKSESNDIEVGLPPSSSKCYIIEGDWENREIPPYFEGLQSSFEEKVNDEGKYEIEILSNNKNLFDVNKHTLLKSTDNYIEVTTTSNENIKYKLKPNTNYTLSFKKVSNPCWIAVVVNDIYVNNSSLDFARTYTTSNDGILNISIRANGTGDIGHRICDLILEEGNQATTYVPHKQNKIKLLINEPLRSTPHNISDRLCIKDKRLVVERKCGEITLDGSEDWILDQCFETFGQVRIGHIGFDRKNKPRNKLYSTTYTQCKIYSDNIKNASKLVNNSTKNLDTVFAGDNEHYALFVKFKNSTLGLSDGVDVGNFISKVKEYLRNKNVTVVYELATPYYEEVTNEYGEPIILEGYENGTIYIDSTIIPTTSIRYTPKMESFKALKEVNNNNIMLTNDVNDNIIPYMMDVDLMIMEKEMALMSHKNIRTIGVKDMTSMQKRTQDMLTRLIKGKTLTEQECKTRVVTYLDAGKITDAQADELMLLISEVYA